MADRKLTKHWILIKGNSIFNKPYVSLDEAKADLRKLDTGRPGHGYVLEERQSWQLTDF